jgi:hypothetical protein
MSSCGTAAQLSFSIGFWARLEPSWMARATSSLPVPRSPVMSTGAEAVAASRTRSRSSRITALSPRSVRGRAEDLLQLLHPGL